MTTDVELLRRYATENAEDAFGELVRRHLGLVYFSALRQLGGDEHLAKDIAQSVFTDLARKAMIRTPAGWRLVVPASAVEKYRERVKTARDE